MGNFRSDNRSGFGGRSNRERSGGSRFSGRSEGRDRFGDRDRDRDRSGGRDFRRSERRPLEMHDVICDKCKKQCQVPFKPTSDKPVYCSDCFRKNEGSDNNYNPRNQNRALQSGISQEQFNQLNAKLDKIIQFLQDLEIESDEDSDDEFEDDSGEELEDSSEEESNNDSKKEAGEDLDKESEEDDSKNF